jgi:hypothetical protein
MQLMPRQDYTDGHAKNVIILSDRLSAYVIIKDTIIHTNDCIFHTNNCLTGAALSGREPY